MLLFDSRILGNKQCLDERNSRRRLKLMSEAEEVAHVSGARL